MSKKLEQLHDFLRGNVVSPVTPKEIVLFDFEFDTKEFKGSFQLKLDSDAMKERFTFSNQIDGKYEISPPFHISPLGVPASYPKIELTEETTTQIKKLIDDTFPILKPLGLDKVTGKMIDRNTPKRERIIDISDVIWKTNQWITDGFELKWISK
jgi:hypothetical protein